MAYVPFTTTGTLKTYPSEAHEVDTTFLIINPETYAVITSGVFTGSGNYTLSDIHTSLDRYYTLFGGYGYVGDAGLMSGFSPTTPLYVNRFQAVNQIEADEVYINFRDFEDSSLSGLNLSFVNPSGVVTSGLLNNSNLEGNYNLGFSSTSIASCVVEPTDTTTTGILCGRAVWLARLGTGASVSNSATAFAFLRQSTAPNSPCYKLTTETAASNDRYQLMLRAGQMTNASGNITSNGDGALVTVSQQFLDFSSNAVRDSFRNILVGIEWEVVSKGVLFRIYSKLYESGDTLQVFKDEAYLLSEHFYCGTTSETGIYTNTSEVPAWLLGSDSTSTGQVAIDLLHLEKLPTLTSGGIADFEILERNTASGGGDMRPLLSRRLANSTGYPPEAAPFLNSSNPLIKPTESVFSIAGAGYRGIEITPLGGANGDTVFTCLVPKSEATSGITKGVARLGAQVLGVNNGRIEPRLAFSFLRQGNLINSNCYTLELRLNNNEYRVRLRKGTVYDSAFGDSSNFNGTILVDSADITSISNAIGYLWLEVRWEVIDPSSVKIEVLISPMNSSLTSFDSSPGNVDYGLTQVLTYNDTSSPYFSTSAKPMITLRSTSPTTGSSLVALLQAEIRKAKWF